MLAGFAFRTACAQEAAKRGCHFNTAYAPKSDLAEQPSRTETRYTGVGRC